MDSKTSNDSTKTFQRIYGKVEHWEFWMSREIAVEFWYRTDGKRMVEPVRPDSTGTFLIDLQSTSEVAKAWHSSGAELRAMNKEGRVLGSALLPFSDQLLITATIKMDIKIQKPEGESIMFGWTPTDIISSSARRRLAELVAALDGIELRQAKAPHGVLEAIADLNEISMLAVSVRARRKDAAALLRHTLKDTPIDNQSILGNGYELGADRGLAAFAPYAAGISEHLPSARGCLANMPTALEVMEAAFALDFTDRNKVPVWTNRAGGYLRQRLHYIESFAKTVRRTVARGGGRLPRGVDESVDLILPPTAPDFPLSPGGTDMPEFDSGLDAGPIPGIDEPDVCDMVHDLCISLFVEVAAATLRDEYIDWISAVEPNCLCSNYDPNRDFIARPAANRPFPATLPTGVQLCFGNQIITQFSITPNEIRFKIPPNSHSGPVHLRMLGQTPSQASRRLASACGNIVPDLPHEILFDRSPAAFISIIYPPVIKALTANGQSVQMIGEACRPVEICWISHLSDQSAGEPIVPCGSIRLIVHELIGGREAVLIDTTAPAGCISVTAPEDRIYRAVAKSYAHQTECGSSAIANLLVHRVPHIRLSMSGNGTNEVLGGDSTHRFAIEIEISCPAPAGGIPIQLVSSDTQVLQVPRNVTVPEGSTKVEVALTTTAIAPGNMCRTIHLNASAAGYVSDFPLEIIIYRKPNLRWDGPAPTVSLCHDFSLKVFADCLAEDFSRVEWVMVSPVWTEPNGQRRGQAVRMVATNDSPNHYLVTLPQAERPNFTKSGTWELRIQIGRPIRLAVSDPIPLEVVGGTVSGSLRHTTTSFDICQSTTVEVLWNVSAVQAIRLKLDGNTVHEEGGPSAPLTEKCGSKSGRHLHRIDVPTGGTRLGSQKQLTLEGLPFEGTWQRLDTISLTGRVAAINPTQSYTILNRRNEKLFIYTESTSGLVDRLELQVGGSSSIPLRDCISLTIRVYTETPPLTWPPAGHRNPPLWNPGSAEWVIQFPSFTWCKMVKPGVMKVTGAPALIDSVI